ncbi:MAG: SpoIIE family protein phosphatase [Betaproteobacteria bacterium]|nr:SpoIIE family protein phosphatase [Betaproteobacteria bacterium]
MADDQHALVAVVDGVGHGSHAAAAALEATSIIQEHGASESLTSLVQRCHNRLRAGRGVVMSLAKLDAETRTMIWLGVGNVAGALRRRAGAFSRKSETLLLRAGVVGKQLPPLHTATLPVVRGDVLILATDGIGGDFAESVKPDWEPQRIADDLAARFGKRTDDVLVLVARFVR